MKTAKTSGITTINTTALQNINNYFDNVNQQEENDRVSVNVKFDGYNELICSIAGLLDGIELLSIHSNASEKENLSIINTLASIGKKLIPFAESEFIDTMLFTESYRTNETFVDLANLQKNTKDAIN